MNPYDYPEAVEIFNKVKNTLDDKVTFTRLLHAIHVWRGHPIDYVEIDLEPGLFGCVAPCRDRDLLCVSKDLSPEMKRYISAHEIGHVLAGDVKEGNKCPNAPFSNDFIHNTTIRNKYLKECKAFSDRLSEDIYIERRAEAIGILLLDNYSLTDIPQMAAKLYGWRKK